MVACTTVAHDKDWDDPSAWTPRVPLDNDSFVLNHRIRFNVNQSAMPNGMTGWTCNVGGKLTASTTPGTYYLKMKGNATGAASPALEVGSPTVPYPTNCNFTIFMNGNFSLQFSASGAYQIYGHVPAIPSIKLSGAEAAGQTALSVDTDVSADPDWTDATVRIDDIDSAATDSELRTISSITPTEVTITAGLSLQKLQGAWLHTLKRNVTLQGTNTIINGGIDHIIKGTAFIGGAVAFNIGTNQDLEGCVISGFSNAGFVQSTTVKLKNTIISAVVNPINIVPNVFLLDSKITGLGSPLGVVANAIAYNTVFAGVSNGILNSVGKFYDCQFYGNLRDITQAHDCVFYNCLFGSATENFHYNFLTQYAHNYTVSYDHDQIAGDFRSWTRGGVTSKNSSTLTTPRGEKSHQTTFENPLYPGFWQERVTVQGGQRLIFTAWLRKSTTMTIKPRVQVFLEGNDPLITGASPLSENIMTDSVDTWESFTVSLSNTYLQNYVIRFQGQNASGTMDADLLLQRDIVTNQEFEMTLRVGDPISFTAFYQDAVTLLGKTGLAPTVDVYRDTGHIIDDAAAVEIGDGFYIYNLSSALTNQAGVYRAVFKTTVDGVITKSITDRIQLASWLNQFSAIGIQSATALKADGKTLLLERGDDYLDSDGWAVTWPPLTGITSLIGATGQFKITGFSAALVILSADTVRLELTATQTRNLPIGEYIYELEFILANGHVISPLKGILIVSLNL